MRERYKLKRCFGLERQVLYHVCQFGNFDRSSKSVFRFILFRVLEVGRNVTWTSASRCGLAIVPIPLPISAPPRKLDLAPSPPVRHLGRRIGLSPLRIDWPGAAKTRHPRWAWYRRARSFLRCGGCEANRKTTTSYSVSRSDIEANVD